MIRYFIIISTLLLQLIFLVGCNSTGADTDPSNNDSGNLPAVSCPADQNSKCDVSLSFSGINQTTLSIFDDRISFSWNLSSSASAYLLFKVENNMYSLVTSFNSTTDNYVLSDLSAETDYQFILKAISLDGSISCNSEVTAIRTTVKTEFDSCYDIISNNPAMLSGYYDIKPEGESSFLSVYCDMEHNGGGWTKVFFHDHTAGLFLDKNDALEKNILTPSDLRYSILSKLEKFKRDNKFTFWIYYPELDDADGGNIWTQTSNPTVSGVTNYISIRNDYSTQRWGGLEKSTNSATFIDGSVNHSNWYYSIGSNSSWSGGIPGPNPAVQQVVLYIK